MINKENHYLDKELQRSYFIMPVYMDLIDKNIKVKEAFLTVSGVMFVVIECFEGILTIGTTLMSESNDTWIISEVSLLFGHLKDKALLAGYRENTWFLYKLKPLGHGSLPATNTNLLVLQHGS